MHAEFLSNVTEFSNAAKEEFKLSFVEIAFTIHDVLLSDPTCEEIINQAEEQFGLSSPFNSAYKLDAIIRKVGRQKASELSTWALRALIDLMVHEHYRTDDLSVSAMLGKAKAAGGKRSD